MNTNRLRRGWTLIDVSLAVLILGVMSAIAVPRYLSTLDAHRVDAAGRRIQRDLAWARQQALSRSATVTVAFDVSQSAYTIPQITHVAHGGNGYRVDLASAPYTTSLVSADFGDASQVAFNRFGFPQASGDVVVAAGSAMRTVRLSVDGRRTTIE